MQFIYPVKAYCMAPCMVCQGTVRSGIISSRNFFILARSKALLKPPLNDLRLIIITKNKGEVLKNFNSQFKNKLIGQKGLGPI